MSGFPLRQSPPSGTRSYSAISGFFAQDSPYASGIPAITPRFGLLDESAQRWKKFFSEIEQLNASAGANTSYKVFFLGRHGQGYHNVAETKYGTQAWDDHWSKLNGDEELVWGPDPELTTLGEGQAVDARDAWKSELAAGIPLPGKFYSSPMSRALKTCELTFGNYLSDGRGRPTILENCREENGIHTCDKRRPATYIAKTFPQFRLEPGFTEDDLLWDPDARETKSHVASRAQEVFNQIFEQDDDLFISITAHGGIINGFLTTIGRPVYALPTGGKNSASGCEIGCQNIAA